jgi:glucokinase
MIIAGDIGGTKCQLAAFEERGADLRLIARQRYATGDHSSFEEVLSQFCEELRAHSPSGNHIRAAGFGVPGTVVNGRLYAFNLPWAVESASLATALNLPSKHVVLLNDLMATAFGLDKLSPDDFLPLNQGIADPRGNKAVIAAGTGLGEAVLYWDGRRHRAAPSEGGSADFAPRDEREARLLLFLKKNLPRVSCEDIFSGRGFRKLHEFLDPTVIHSTFGERATVSASEITHNAFQGSCSVCVEVLEWWIDAFGAEAGNLALRVLAYGGVFLAGGIAVKILPKLKESSFCRSFANKGPMTEILSRIPISVILNEDTPVLGAAHRALVVAGAASSDSL